MGTREERNAEIVRLYKTGMRVREIGQAFGITYQRVSQIAVAAGVSSNRVHPTALRAKVRKAAILGYGTETAAAIAARLGVSRNCVIGYWDRARKAGLLHQPVEGERV